MNRDAHNAELDRIAHTDLLPKSESKIDARLDSPCDLGSTTPYIPAPQGSLASPHQPARLSRHDQQTSGPESIFFERDRVPKNPFGKELYERFQERMFRTNPGESPMARALVAHGYEVVDHPLYPQYTDSDWLASRVLIGGLSIVFRQPTPEDLFVCFIKRESANQKIASPLFGIATFFAFCRYDCPGLKYVGGTIDKQVDYKNNTSTLDMDRLVAFYNRILGDIEAYEANGIFFIYAEVHRNFRFEKFPIWKRCRRRTLLTS